MANLYTDLAEVYEAMYQTFIDYEEEYQFYADILKKSNSVDFSLFFHNMTITGTSHIH